MDWIKRFILFHDKRHPKAMSAAGLEAFLSHLAVERDVSASARNGFSIMRYAHWFPQQQALHAVGHECFAKVAGVREKPLV